MKKIILSTFLTLYACTSISQDQIKNLKDPLLIRIMALSESKDLNKLQPNIEKNLWVKVFQLPSKETNNCFPESHGICRYKYYVATSQLDDSPIINAYSLGSLGEIIEYRWISTSSTDTAVLHLKVNKYTREALSYNSLLKNEQTIYRLVAKPNVLKIEKLDKWLTSK